MLNDNRPDDFEEFLKQSADDLRMHPSDGVWRSVSKSLKERRRRIGFITTSFFLISSLLGYILVQTKDVVKPIITKQTPVTTTGTGQVAQKTAQKGVQSSFGTAKVVPLPLFDFTKKQATNRPQTAAVVRPLYQAPEKTSDKGLVSVTETFAETLTGATPEKVEAIAADFPLSILDSNPEAVAEVSNESTSLNLNTKTDNILTIESVTNAFRLSNKKNKLSFLLFFTPTVSYRKLTENKAYLESVPQNAAAVNYAALYNVNQAVTHKPDMGLEVGISAKYKVAKNISLRGGLQFNMSRYDIKAFVYPTEFAQIALNTGAYGVNYTGSATNYRNFGGGKANWLQNLYFQLSAPIGAEVKLASSAKTSFGVAATIQPTYGIGDRAYMLSTDYKNYTEVPWLMRKWNANTSVEAFVSYSTGKVDWQVGPQVRYQLLSSFVTEYPVSEHLFDFGLKIGVSLKNDKKSSNNQ